jgi:phosphoenolpyruvate carboxylase
MYSPNLYSLDLEREDGEQVHVDLRLNTAGQITLKKHWQENTLSTLFEAIDDIERFVDVLTQSLNYPGNKNTIKKGEELADLMALNGMLGILAKQKLVTDLAKASGILSVEEKAAMDERASKLQDSLTSTDEGNA